MPSTGNFKVFTCDIKAVHKFIVQISYGFNVYYYCYCYYYYCYFYLDTKENASVSDTLQKIWAVLEINLEQYALSLLR